MKNNQDFTQGKILLLLLRFAVPVLFVLFLQSLYSAVDLLVVGKFAAAADVSAVSTGSQIMMTLTGIVSSFAMGTTIFIGQKIGAKKPREAGQIVGSGLLFFFAAGIVLTVLIPAGARPLALIMHAPKEALSLTTAYIRICGAGFLVILAIVNSLGLTESAGIGVAEKVCAFIMLVPSAFMQATRLSRRTAARESRSGQ